MNQNKHYENHQPGKSNLKGKLQKSFWKKENNNVKEQKKA